MKHNIDLRKVKAKLKLRVHDICSDEDGANITYDELCGKWSRVLLDDFIKFQEEDEKDTENHRILKKITKEYNLLINEVWIDRETLTYFFNAITRNEYKNE